MPDDLLAIDNLDVAYGSLRRQHRVLEDVSLTIAPGETVGLVGESGSGKTSLGRAVLGLARATAGSITFAGSDITHANSRERRTLARHIQVVFQDPYSSLNPAMRIRDILTEPLLAQGIGARESTARVRDLLDRVSMPADSLDRFAREFSGGQRQRVAIARALALNPRLIICDEPVSALDLSTQLRVLELLIEVQERTGVAYLFISHDLAVIRHVSHRVAVMYQGRIVEMGDAGQVTSAPTHVYTQRLWAANLVADPDQQAERRALRRSLAEGVTI